MRAATLLWWGMREAFNSLDESIWFTFWRDFKRAASNTKAVLFVFRENTAQVSTPEVSVDWDLWGPLVSVLSFSILLSMSATGTPGVFSVVFYTVVLGSIMLTLNVLLLGGRIIFLQALSWIGYCMLPTVVAAGATLASTNKAYRSCLLFSSVAWSSYASVQFVSASVSGKRKELATYPIILLNVSVAVLSLVNI